MEANCKISWTFVLLTLIDPITGCLPNEECFTDFRYAHCLAVGFNYPGNGIFHFNDSSLSKCNQECQADSRCEHSTFFLETKQCFGKSMKNTVYIKDDMQYITIPKICIPGCTMDAWDFRGNDVTVFSTTNYLECYDRCQTEPNCIIGVWVHPWSNFVPGMCYLKSVIVMSNKKHHYGMVTIPKYCLEHHRLPDNEFQFQNSKYQFIAGNNTLAEGRELCEARKGSLVSMETKDEFSFIRSAVLQLNTFNSSTFVGDYRIGLISNSTKWIWSSGWNYDKNVFNIWCNGFPSGTSGNVILEVQRSCVTLKTGSEYVENFICEIGACDGLSLPNITNSKRERQNHPLAYK